MITPDPDLEPDWDDYNIEHIAKHGLKPEQVEELYYGEGPYPTLALRSKKKIGRTSEYRYRLWGTMPPAWAWKPSSLLILNSGFGDA